MIAEWTEVNLRGKARSKVISLGDMKDGYDYVRGGCVPYGTKKPTTEHAAKLLVLERLQAKIQTALIDVMVLKEELTT